MGIFGDYAQRYFENGLSVIPIDGKKPMIKEWNKYSESLPTQDDIDKWVTDFSNANIGIVCGKASNLTIVDFDFTGQESEKIEKLLKSILPPSSVVKKGARGWSNFYQYIDVGENKMVNRNGARLVDFLSDGKQTVIPPSIHPDTKSPYLWISPDTLDSIAICDLPKLDNQVISKIMELEFIDLTSAESVFAQRSGRHDVICSYAWAIIEKVSSLEELAKLIYEYDLKKHPDAPYFSDKKYFKRKEPIKSAHDIAKRIEKTVIASKKKKGIDWKIGITIEKSFTVGIDDVVKNTEGFFFTVEKQNKKGEKYFEVIPDYHGMANRLRDENVLKVTNNSILVYRDNYWQNIGNNELMNLICLLNKESIKHTEFAGYEKMIIAKCFDELFFRYTDNIDGMMNLNNCILHVPTGKTISHSSKYSFLNKIEIDYSPQADCHKWSIFLNEIFENDNELINLTQEMLGYILIGGTPFLHRAFVLVGDGRNGKSTFIDVFRKIIGSKSTSAVSIKNLDKPFSAVMLDGKLANLVEETPSGEINAEAFKAAVGGGLLTAAHKGFDEFDLRVKARFIFACNKMPTFDDKGESLLDRLVIIPFNKYFEPDKRDVFLFDKLCLELPGIINWALIGAKRVIERKKLTEPIAVKKALETYKTDSDPFYAWFNEHIEPGVGMFSGDIYTHYKVDLERNNNHPLSANNFFRRLAKECKKDAKKYAGFSSERKSRTVGKETYKNLTFYNAIAYKQ